MFTKRMALHEGGHGHAGCCGEHAHEHAHEHVCGHHHEHGAEVPELTPEQTLALMSYMSEHNRSHAAELHGVAHSLEKQANWRRPRWWRRPCTILTTATTSWTRRSGW